MGLTLKLIELPEEAKIDIKNRVGQFSLPEYFLEKDLEFQGLLAYMRITHCEYIYHRRVFEYVAHSPLFDEVGHAEVAPRYTISITRAEDGTYVEALREK